MAKRKPNIVDVVMILVLAAVCVLAIYKFGFVNSRESAGVEAEATKREYTAFIDEVRMATAEALHKGDLIFDDKTGICIGEIKDVSYAPMMKGVIAADGTVKQAEYPDYYGVTLTIEGSIIEKDEGYFVDGVVELKANSEMNTFTKYAMPVIKITSIAD